MASPIQLKRSKTAGNTPASLVDGEVAINIPDRLLYVNDGAGTIRNVNLTSDAEKIASGQPIGNAITASPVVSTTMPNDGLAGDGASARRIIITSDAIDATANWGGIAGRAFRVAHTVGGATLMGGRIAAEISLIHSAPDSPSNPLPEFVGLTASVYGTSQGGFGGQSLANPRGSLYAGNSYVETRSGYTNLVNVTSHEFNLNSLSGSSAFLRQGIQIVSRGPVRGSLDTAIGVSAGGSGGGTRSALLIGDQNSNGTSPIDATGTLFATYTSTGTPFTVATAFDLSAFDFSGYLLRSQMAVIDTHGSMAFGRTNVASTINLSFRSGGQGQPSDARIQCAGGASSAADSGVLSCVAALTQIYGSHEFQNVPRSPDAGFMALSADDGSLYLSYRNGSGQLKRAAVALTNVSG